MDLNRKKLDFFNEANKFLSNLFEKMNQVSLNVSDYELDHICYRVISFDEYEEYKVLLSEVGDKLIESEVGGRAIATYKLNTPISFYERRVFIVELPAPKQVSQYSRGFEHAEFVIPHTFDRFIELNEHCCYDLAGSKKAINPDIRVSFGTNMSVKFHHNSLEDIIELEKTA